MSAVWAKTALTASGWQNDVRLTIAADGTIQSVDEAANAAPGDTRVAILLPAPVNLHSHAFQRAMAGLTERRGPELRDSFWTWRQLMYRFLDALAPDDVEAIAAFVQMEMLEAGYGAVAEFHYLHHQPDGTPYAAVAELSERIVAAAATTGIGLTLLPVLYQYGGCDRRPPGPGQVRFANSLDRFARLYAAAESALTRLPADAGIGVAPHSLRAVDGDGLAAANRLAAGRPLHIHISEQQAEVDEVVAAFARRPVEWLFANHDVDRTWCLIHATHMQPHETELLARSGAVAGLCPITEANLGDGIFDGVSFLGHGGCFGVGSDSNIQITLAGELRMLEYSQRLRHQGRAMLATATASTGRTLFDHALTGGARAAGRDAGAIAPGRLADLVALDGDAIDLAGRSGDAILDGWIFAVDEPVVSDVWTAGRHVVTAGRHHRRDAITARYRNTVAALRDRL